MLKPYHTHENLNIDISSDLSSDLSVPCYKIPDGGFEVVIGEEIYPIRVKERKRLVAAMYILMLGPAGVAMNYGFIAGFFSLCTYGLIAIKLGIIGLGAFHTFSILAPFVYFSKYKILDNEIRKKAKVFLEQKWEKSKLERKQSEANYYSSNGGSRLKTILFGDPNARASLIASGKAVKDSISKRDGSKLKEAEKHFKDSNDPIDSSNNKAS